MKGRYNKFTFFAILSVLYLASFVLCLMFGGARLSANELFSALFSSGGDTAIQTIVREIRLPRVFLGFVVGGGLALSGCVFQGILRNPLADPYTLGVSGGAAFGATFAIIFGLTSFWHSLFLPVFSFCGALLSIFLVYLVASKKSFSQTTLILSGVTLSFIFSGVVLILFTFAAPDKVQSALLWLMGDLSWADKQLIKVASVFNIAGMLVLLFFSRDLNLLSLGEEKAMQLGLNAWQTKKFLFLIASLITGTSVSSAGIIGFVGLIVPHFIRQLIGPDHKFLIPASILTGGIFLSICDMAARTIFTPVELPVGVITGIIGGLFFLLYLILSKKGEVF